jgi:hypothetical protein
LQKQLGIGRAPSALIQTTQDRFECRPVYHTLILGFASSSIFSALLLSSSCENNLG